MAFRCGASLGSFNLDQCLSLSLSFMPLIFLKSADRLFGRTPLNVGLFDAFFPWLDSMAALLAGEWCFICLRRSHHSWYQCISWLVMWTFILVFGKFWTVTQTYISQCVYIQIWSQRKLVSWPDLHHRVCTQTSGFSFSCHLCMHRNLL